MGGRNLLRGVAIAAMFGLASGGLIATTTLAAGAAFSGYSLGDLSLQNGWDGGAGGGGFTNNNAGSDVISNADAHSGTQSWLYGGSYNSPGAGTPFTPDVATVGALNATSDGSPITPAGNKSVVSFAFKAVAPGDGSRINVYEGSNSRDDRTGGSLYLQNDSLNGNPAGTVDLFNFASAGDAPDCNTPSQELLTVPSGGWHTVEMTSNYPNITLGNPSTYGSTTYVVDKGTVDEQTATMQSWAHPWRECNGLNYAPGGSLKWASSFNDYPTHQGYYIDDLSMKVINTNSNTTVGSFVTSFEANPCTTVCFVAPGGSGDESGTDAANAMATIQAGVDAVNAGGTVNVAAGTYAEHVTIGKKLDLVGAGTSTVITPSSSGPAITVTAGGASNADRLKIRNLKITGVTGSGNTGSGIQFAGSSAIDHVTIDHVDSVSNGGNGVTINTSSPATMSDLVMSNDNLSSNVNDGFRIPMSLVSLDGLSITDSHLDGNGLAGWETYVASLATNQPVKNVAVTNTSFDNNVLKGIYSERLSDAVFQNIHVSGSGSVGASSAGIDLNLKFQPYQNISILNSTITGDGAGDPATGAGIEVKARGGGSDSGTYTAQPATLTNVTITGNTFGTNTPVGIRFGEPGKNNTGPTNVHVNQNSITSNTAFGMNNQTTITADATCNYWGAADGPGGQGPGSGDNVSSGVTFSPFKVSLADPCPAATTVVVKPSTMHGWAFVNENTDAVEQGTFVAGPSTPPAGSGSVQLSTPTAADHRSILNGSYAGTPLSSISTLSYSTNQPGPTLAIALQFDIRYRPSDSAYGGRLVFEPYQNGAVTVGSGWQNWNALDGSGPADAHQGLWWSSKTTAAGSNGVCLQASPCTWTQVLALFPNATINPSGGNVVLGAGSNWAGFVGQADALTIGVPGSLKTFDFEAPAATDVVVTPPAMNGWNFVNEQTDALENPGTFVTGPTGQPKGVGSVQLATPTASDHHSVLTNAHAGTPLSKVTQLDYWTNQPGPTLAIALQFDIKYRTGDTNYGGRFVFEPYQNGAVTVGSGWQHWNALDGSGPTGGRQGLWWSSKTNANGSAGVCLQASPCTWAQVLAAFPNAKMDNPASPGNGNLALGAGSNWAGFTGQADALTIGIDSANTTYNFEPAIVPGAPTGVSALRGDSSAQVSFTPPVNNGGDPSLTYTATCAASGHTTRTAGGSTSPITVLSLDNGTLYSCTVHATNLAGDGPESAAATVTPAAVPSAPTGVTATRGDSSASVGYTTSSSDGGDSITGYTATCAASSHTTRTGTGSSPITVSSLDNGTLYSCTVHATNSVGDSIESNIATVTPATLPGAPTGASATAGNHNASVAFTAPASDGGDAITSYTATCASSDPGTHPTQSNTGASSPIVVSSLDNPIQYVCVVQATNSVGSGPNSNYAFVTPADPPDAPTAVAADASETQATVTWAAPASDGGAPITGYTVAAAPGGSTCTWTTGPLTCTVAGLTDGTDYTFTVTATNSPGTSGPSTASNAVTPEPLDGHYNPLVPARILDTRTGVGHLGALGAGQSFDLQVTGQGGVPASGVSAVVMNVTVTHPTAASFLTVWPTGVAQPVASNLNFVAGQTVPNLVTVKVGTGGQVSIFNGHGSTTVVGDVVGWYSDNTATGGSRLQPLVPARILDTRFGIGHSGAVGPGQTIDLQVTGQGGVPASGVSAVVMNVTATSPTATSFLTVWPSGVPQPVASNLNFVAGRTVPNLVIVKVGAGGKVSFFNGAGSVDVIGDVVGWFSTTDVAGGSRLQPLVPTRILDTRDGTGHSGAIGAGGSFDLQVTGLGGVPGSGVSAVVMNVTVTGPSAASFLTVWPSGVARPIASNLNFRAGQTVPNLVVVKVGAGGKISFFNGAGSTHVVADIVGWYASP